MFTTFETTVGSNPFSRNIIINKIVFLFFYIYWKTPSCYCTRSLYSISFPEPQKSEMHKTTIINYNTSRRTKPIFLKTRAHKWTQNENTYVVLCKIVYLLVHLLTLFVKPTARRTCCEIRFLKPQIRWISLMIAIIIPKISRNELSGVTDMRVQISIDLTT